MINEVKYVIVAIYSSIIGLLLPIKDFMTAMIILFFINYLFGVVADISQGKPWSFKKSMVFFYHCLLFFFITVNLFLIGRFLHATDDAVGCIKTLCGIAIYFYVTNIMRNWKLALPNDSVMYRVADALYYILSLQLIDRIHYLGGYLKSNKDTDNADKKDNIE
jgi:energy-coupling factor transporter transmembrane protein EcfT